MTDAARSPYTFIRTATREEIEKADIAVCVLGRAEIEGFRIGSAVDHLMVLTDEDETCRRLESKVMLVVEGYDNDSRKLFEIPECVAFVRALTSEWPHWYHFLDRSTDEPGLLLWLLVDPTDLLHDEDGATLRCAGELRCAHERLLVALDRMHDRLDYDAPTRERIRVEILQSLRESGFKSLR